MQSNLNCTPRFIAGLALALLLFVTAGCRSKSAATPQNFIVGLNAHFLAHPECLFPESPRFPYETTDPVKTKQMNALVTSQLLTVHEERDIHASRYIPTVIGARYAPLFCYGHRVISSIESFTPPAKANGFPETQVVYHYTVEDVPVWAKSEDVRAAFPAMAHAIGGTGTDTATLAATIAGWSVPE